jgi:hypothetical protein
MSRFRLQYSANDYLTAGISSVYLEQRYHNFHKRGEGDTNLSVKFCLQPYPDVPFRIGLRQSLSLPTGYEMERDGLAPFTSRNYDHATQLLLSYATPQFSVMANPGVLLPGGDANSCLTAGLGLSIRLPLAFDAMSEYYTRWDIVDHQWAAEVSGAVRHTVLWRVACQAGIKRRLLQHAKIEPEYSLALSFGRDRPTGEPKPPPPPVRSTGLLIHPIEMSVSDPYGVKGMLLEELRSQGRRRDEPVTIFLGGVAGAVSDEALRARHYELNLRILDVDEAKVGGVQVTPLVRAGRGRSEITAQAELIAPDGYTVVRREIVAGKGARILGIDLAPESGSLESTVVPDEVRTRLRREAIQDLAKQLLDSMVAIVVERDGL